MPPHSIAQGIVNFNYFSGLGRYVNKFRGSFLKSFYSVFQKSLILFARGDQKAYSRHIYYTQVLEATLEKFKKQNLGKNGKTQTLNTEPNTHGDLRNNFLNARARSGWGRG